MLQQHTAEPNTHKTHHTNKKIIGLQHIISEVHIAEISGTM